MYTIKKQEEILESCNYENYKLCYIDDIDQTYSDYTPETKEYMKSEAYKKDKELHGWNNPNVRTENHPNPEYILGKQEYYAFFTPLEMCNVVGDDMDDQPYEYNSGIPYDTDRHNHNIEIIKVPFAYPDGLWEGNNLTIKQPKDGFCNSPWTAEDINLGAVPWIFARTNKYKYGNYGVSIMAGISPREFIKKLKDIKNLASSEEYEDLGLYEYNKVKFRAIRNKKTWYVRFFDPITNEPIPVFKEVGYYGETSFHYQLDEEDWNKYTEDTNDIRRID
jgi:hypothetical protein